MANPLFQKGAQPGPGRPVGMQNKKTRNLKDAIAFFLDEKYDGLNQWFEDLTSKEKIQTFVALVGYIVPRKATVERTNGIEIPKELEALTFEQIVQIENIIQGKPIAYEVESTERKITNGSKPF
jgi:hypothetical protein